MFISVKFWYMHCLALRTFWHMDVSTWECFNMRSFQAQGIFNMRNLRLRNISAQGHFSTRMFWWLANQYGHFGTEISVPVLLCQDVHVPKSPCAEMFLGRKLLTPKIPLAKKSLCRNVPVLKSLSAGMSAVTNGAHAKMFPDETSVPKWLFPKSQVPKWWEAFHNIGLETPKEHWLHQQLL